MRELKFRVWDGNNQRFEYPELIERGRGIEYEQFTGHMDIADMELYENDIIEWSAVTGFEDGIGCVVWNNDHAGFFIENDNTDVYDELYNFTPTHYLVRVIGNIHQNPELLEVP